MQSATSDLRANCCSFNFSKHCTSHLILPINYNLNGSVFDVGMPLFSKVGYLVTRVFLLKTVSPPFPNTVNPFQ